MIIIKSLKPWVGKELTCPCCESILKLEESDKVLGGQSIYTGDYSLIFNCPVCEVQCDLKGKF